MAELGTQLPFLHFQSNGKPRQKSPFGPIPGMELHWSYSKVFQRLLISNLAVFDPVVLGDECFPLPISKGRPHNFEQLALFR